MTETCSLVSGCENPETTGGGCVRHKFAGGIRVNGIALFRHDRDLDITQAQKAREMFEGAKEDGIDIQAVRGKRRAHEKRVDGNWEKI